MKTKALQLALEALENSVGLVINEALLAEELYGRYPTRQARVAGMKKIADDHQAAIAAIKEALAQEGCCATCGALHDDQIAKQLHKESVITDHEGRPMTYLGGKK